MLGSGDSYIAGCKNLIRSLYGARFSDINEVAYQTPGVIWMHITHPSGTNGYFNPWMNGAASDPLDGSLGAIALGPPHQKNRMNLCIFR
jgi:hypothetical protein